ncbi:MAG: hypothetical protein Q7J82_02510 [Coriobacteriia bacterium]|nr:hypothetical protein [Coriobacteriia bacterium]
MSLRANISAKKMMAVLALVLVCALVVLLWVLFKMFGGADLVGFSEGSTDEIMYVERFPASEDPALENPIGIDSDGRRLYVAESGAGCIAVFTLDGRRLDDIAVPPAEGRSDVYPSDVAVMGDGRIAVTDNASARVLVLRTDKKAAPVSVIGEDGSRAPDQPTALAYANGELFVADGSSHTVLVFSADSGEYLRELGQELSPPLTYCGGMFLAEDGLHITDSNAGRVLVLDARSGELVHVLPEHYVLPRGIVQGIDSEEFVVDTFGKKVVAITGEGIRRFGTDELTDPMAELLSPRDACWIGEHGRLYVTDANAGDVVVYNVRLPGAE